MRWLWGYFLVVVRRACSDTWAFAGKYIVSLVVVPVLTALVGLAMLHWAPERIPEFTGREVLFPVACGLVLFVLVVFSTFLVNFLLAAPRIHRDQERMSAEQEGLIKGQRLALNAKERPCACMDSWDAYLYVRDRIGIGGEDRQVDVESALAAATAMGELTAFAVSSGDSRGIPLPVDKDWFLNKGYTFVLEPEGSGGKICRGRERRAGYYWYRVKFCRREIEAKWPSSAQSSDT